ncbi:phosphoribosylpyrophosphate synthetase [Xanthomarina sp. F1114]|uniref:phosphoribosylpyrophosphate synthetase n=1 Tax=Xanthomarina sp. F1114 TaxID=2996019 RepID=UPI00225DCFC9|nr:phosphoribosylpyrophosphate synthetase [Xanthomarina sp. F1114]MCX7548630.1 phosphoribosylpyrophosphate synthetase [Xanthomarina sp. F1114]
MKQKSYDTVSEATNDLMQRGYTTNFALMSDKECLVCHKTSVHLSPDDFEIDEIHRFEGMTDPGDEMIVYAISSLKYNMKGVVVNAYGMYADNSTTAIVKKLSRAEKK